MIEILTESLLAEVGSETLFNFIRMSDNISEFLFTPPYFLSVIFIFSELFDFLIDLSYSINKQAAWPPGAADTVCPRPRARTQLYSFIAGRDS